MSDIRDAAGSSPAAEDAKGAGMRICVLALFVLSLLAPPMLQVALAARRAWWPWLEICSTDHQRPPAPDRNDASWLDLPRLKIRRN